MRPILTAILASSIMTTVIATSATAESPLQRFLAARTEAVSAANAGDLAAAAVRLAEADALVPNHPLVIQMRARVAAADGKTAESIEQWDRYADLGLVADPASVPAFAAVTADPAYQAVADRFAANRAPVGRLEVLATLDQPVIAENVVRDSERRRLLVSTVRGRTILQIADDGEATPYLVADAEVAGIFGLALDPERGLLWATASGLAMAGPLPEELTDRTELLKIDLASGRLLARFPQTDDARRSFGDLAVGPDGAVYVSDSIGGEIFRLPVGGAGLERLVAAGALRSPQGLAIAPDGQALIVADYTSGLYRLDPTTGEVFPVAAPEVTLIGIDALVRDGDRFLVVQNGTNPQRVMSLRLDSAASTVLEARVLAANLPEMDEPAGASVVDGHLLLVATGQMSAYGEDGAERRTPPPIIIARLTSP